MNEYGHYYELVFTSFYEFHEFGYELLWFGYEWIWSLLWISVNLNNKLGHFKSLIVVGPSIKVYFYEFYWFGYDLLWPLLWINVALNNELVTLKY